MFTVLTKAIALMDQANASSLAQRPWITCTLNVWYTQIVKVSGKATPTGFGAMANKLMIVWMESAETISYFSAESIAVQPFNGNDFESFNRACAKVQEMWAGGAVASTTIDLFCKLAKEYQEHCPCVTPQ